MIPDIQRLIILNQLNLSFVIDDSPNRILRNQLISQKFDYVDPVMLDLSPLLQHILMNICGLFIQQILEIKQILVWRRRTSPPFQLVPDFSIVLLVLNDIPLEIRVEVVNNKPKHLRI